MADPLITVAALKAYLGLQAAVTDADGRLTAAAKAAEAVCASFCGRETFLVREYARAFCPQSATIVLPSRPVVGVPLMAIRSADRHFVHGDVSAAANTIALLSHGLLTSDGPLRIFVDAGTIPTGLTAATDYWAIRVDEDTLKLATSEANAIAGTAVDISAVGSGMFQLLGPMEARTEYTFERNGVVRWIGWLWDWRYWPIRIVWSAGVCTSAADAPADLLAAITKQAAYEYLQGGLDGRLGNSQAAKQSGVQAVYDVRAMARGVAAALSPFVLRRLGNA